MAKNPQNILFKYISGDCTDSEKSLIEDWIVQSEDNKIEFERTKKLWEANSEYQEFEPDVEAAWQIVAAKTLALNKSLKVTHRSQNPRLAWISGIAASLALIAFSYYYFFSNDQSWTRITAANTTTSSEYVLPDGSKVWLKPESELRYAFNDTERPLKLTGEAFFEVIEDTDRPFQVNLGRAEVTVLGTSFYIKANKNEDLQVSVRSGKVSFSDVENDEITVTLEANQEAILEKVSGDMVRREIEDPNDITWQRGILVFNKTPLNRVIAELVKFYNIEIEVESDSLGNCLITSRFDNQSAEEVLEIIKKLLSAELIKTENGFLLRGEGC